MDRMRKIGRVMPKSANEIENSRIGLGFEKLDRMSFDPERVYDRVAEVGAKWIRIQSGWHRTETERGIYNFGWLDSIVDNLLERGMQPWICLCYGNCVYTPEAKKHYMSVGCPPIATEDEREGWRRYVEALVSRYRGKVQYYEVWNEPDGQWCWKNGVNAEEYADFLLATAGAIRRADPDAKVIGGSNFRRELSYPDTWLRRCANEIDAVTFHEYTPDERTVFERCSALRALCRVYNPKLEVIQGESGSQSRSDGAGAMNGFAWTPRRQAKQLLRHTVADLMCDVKFMSFFSAVDMAEALNARPDDVKSFRDYGYFGLLGAEFDEDGKVRGDYFKKPSYYAMQNLASIFAGDIAPQELPILRTPMKEVWRLGGVSDFDEPTFIGGGFVKKVDGRPVGWAYAYWNDANLLTTEFESVFTLESAALTGDIRLIDTYDGSVYEFPPEMLEKIGGDQYRFKNIPIRDYPLIITFGDFCR